MTPDHATALARRDGGAAAVAAEAAGAGRLSPGFVPRPRLVRRLSSSEAPLALVVAPAGYGKTALLADWAARDARTFAWVSAAAVGDDPDRLAAALLDALDECAGDAPAVVRDAVPLRAAARAIERAAGRCGRVVIVLDDAHHLTEPASLRLVTELAFRLAPGSLVALAARRRPPLPVARLRTHRLALEIGRPDLTMSSLEAALLLSGAGLRLDRAQVQRLYERTGGWPAGLYLAALAVSEQPDDKDAVRRFSGADRLVVDYVRSELLADLEPARLAFLRRASLLTRLAPALCDGVLETTGSAQALDELAGSLPLEPLDRRDSAYRCNPLLLDALRAELGRVEPEQEGRLHRRAADWHRRHGETAIAAGHAVASRDAERAGRLLWSIAPDYAVTGRAASIATWLAAFGERDVRAHPPLALAAAIVGLAQGSRDEAERWTEAAEPGLADASPCDRAAALLLRSCVARDGVRAMAADAARARDLVPPDSAWRAAACLLEGVALHLAGEREAARARLDEGVRRAAAPAPLVDALCHAQLALLAAEADAWEDAAGHAADARAALVPVAADELPGRALIGAVCAEIAARRGDVAVARRDAAEARRRLPALARFTPWLVAEAEIWLARAELRLSDAATARMLLARAARRQPHAPDATVLWSWLHETWERADAFAAGATGEGPSLTTAELRVLRFLPSHLSFREIGARLHVSTNTVKTQALSVYRKLDVSCRSDAVERSRRIGLIDG